MKNAIIGEHGESFYDHNDDISKHNIDNILGS